MKTLKRTYRFRCYPTDEQKTYLAQIFGCVRLVYNEVLAHCMRNYEEQKTLKNAGQPYHFLTAKERDHYLTQFKNERETDPNAENYGQLKRPWIKDVTSVALQQSINNLNTAYKRFFEHHAKHPVFKKKHLRRNSFGLVGKDSSILA